MLDPVLVALADCPVIEQKEEGGHIVFNPYPVISASNDLILAHEICHKLSGMEPYNKFVTSCMVRNNQAFKLILNILLDWWDEKNNSRYSMYLDKRIRELKQTCVVPDNVPPSLEDLILLYKEGTEPEDFPKITCIEDLIVYADLSLENITKEVKMLFPWLSDLKVIAQVEEILKTLTGKNGATRDLSDEAQTKSNFYLKTVSKYNHIIETVCTLWVRNKYEWRSAYFGEINWKNLPALMLGDKLGQAIYRLLSKMSINRNVYLVIDRSGSTGSIKVPIMETAVIIAESFRRCEVPISILDVGHTNSLINKISDPIDFDWFTPLSDGGTPLGKVINLITDSGPDDYLLVVTDGQPDAWNTGDNLHGYNATVGLIDSISKFKGYHLTFVIGNSFKDYYEKLNGHAVSVEPKTIVRELMNDSTLSG